MKTHIAQVTGYGAINGYLHHLFCREFQPFERVANTVLGPTFKLAEGFTVEERDRLLQDGRNINSYIIEFTCRGYLKDGTPRSPCFCRVLKRDNKPFELPP